MEKLKNSGLITKEYVHTFIKERKKEIHKGDCGHILIWAGSKGMVGAAILCARGALRAGAGLVKVAIDEELFPIVQIAVPEAICISTERSLQELTAFQGIVVGPGLKEDESNGMGLNTIFQKYEGTVVVDAGGLNILAKNRKLLNSKPKGLIITPHPGEAGRLLEMTAKEINEDRKNSALRLSQMTGAVTVLKGQATVVATGLGNSYINTTGNPGMATAGSGDVLAGVIGAFAGQGLNPEEAAICGVFIHGMAGDLAAKDLGEYGLIASDIATMVARAISITIR
ncbi:MAG: NAD(P)H-hydrate dehydratase [Anaerovorax sp.]